MKKIMLSSILLLLGAGCTGLDKIQSGIETYQDTKTLLEGSSDHHTVIVAGYGTPVKGNTTYQDYIKQVATYVNNEDNTVDSVVFTGGYTDDKNLSEAESMNSYFNSQVDTTTLQQRGIKVFKEECSIVSWQNISYSQELLTAQGLTPTQVTLFGDINRSDKLKTFAIYKFNLSAGLPDNVTDLVNRSLNAVSVDYQGFDFSARGSPRWSESEAGGSAFGGGDAADSADERDAKFAAEVLGAYDENIGNELLGKRLTEWSATYSYDVAKNLVSKGCGQYAGF